MRDTWKKIASLILTLCLTFSMAPAASAAEGEAATFTEGNIHYRITSGTNVEVYNPNWVETAAPDQEFSPYTGEVTIPATVVHEGTTYSVTTIAAVAFNGANVSSVTLPESVTSIGDSAFAGCQATTITLGSGLKTIGGYAFNNCRFLQSLNIPEGVTSIGDDAFKQCTALTSLTIPGSVQTIGDGAFTMCSSLTALTLGEGIISIGEGAFQLCGSLTNLTIPASVTSGIDKALAFYPSVGDIAFAAGSPFTAQDGILYSDNGRKMELILDKNLVSVTIPEGVTNIPSMFFYPSSRPITTLKSVTIPSTVTEIGAKAFLNCSALETVALSSGLTTIGDMAFGNTALQAVEIPETVTSIGKTAFGGKTPLQTVTMLGANPPEIGQKAFGTGTKFIVPYSSSTAYAEKLGTGANIQEMEAPVVPVTSVTVNQANLNLTVDGTSQLTVTVGPENTTNKAVTWASSNPSVATVTVGEDGVATVIAVGVGTATIIATAGGVSDSCAVTVSAVTVPATGVTVNPAKLTLSIGGTGTLTATREPANATDSVTWSSSDEAVATVENGVVTAAGVGEAIITATAGDVSATCAVTVQPDAIPVTGVTVTADRTSLYNGEVAVLTATVLPENATDKTVTWTSSDETVATVDANGRVTAVSAGSVTITAAAGGVTSEAVFIVVQGPAPVLVGSVNVNPAALNLTEGDARALTATVGPENATNRAVVWTSSNPSVAAVDGNGVVTALRAGSAVITATAIDGGGASGSCTVAVSAYVDPFASYFPDYFDYPSNSGTTAPAQSTEPETPVIPDDPTPTDSSTEITDEEVPLSKIPLLFTDVKTGDWHRDAVAFVFSKGIMGGTSETKFEPETNIDRGMIVTMLHRLEGTPEAAPSAFTDVKDEQYCAEAIGWASRNGIVQGYSDTEFRPTREITREQLASILYRYAQLKGYDTSEQADLSAYADAADVSGYALDGMRWAVAKGLISGVTESTLAPGGSATRAQAAMILMRFCENVVSA